MARRQSVVSDGSDFEVDPGADWEPVKPIHDVLLNMNYLYDLL